MTALLVLVIFVVFALVDWAVNRHKVPVVKTTLQPSMGRLYARQPLLAGAVSADGGRPVDDLLEAIPEANWSKVTAEFFVP
jgi:hypothetical protein